MRLRFRLSPSDRYWSCVYRSACTGGGAFVSYLAWGMGTTFTVIGIWDSGLGALGRSLAVPLIALAWAAGIAGLVLLLNGARMLFAKRDSTTQELVLQLGDDGLEIELNGSRSLHRFADSEGMKRRIGFWMVFDTGGLLVLFRQGRVVEGDAAAFANALNERRT